MLISNCCNLITNKIDVSQLTTSNYISTENLLPNFGGITIATNLPKGKVTKFEKENILMSNIRPYFKKFYYSSISGGCSSDVLVLNVNKSIAIPKYIYYLLCSDKFVNMYVANCKGTKMPRGNKEVLLNYQFELPSYEVQQHIVDTIGSIDDLIENYNKIITKSLSYGDLLMNKIISNSYEFDDLNKYISFERGTEPGSMNYTDINDKSTIRFLRVADLESLTNTFIPLEKSNNKIANIFNILISFDGSLGRIAIGLNGCYSSGIRKVVINSSNYSSGYYYFLLKNDYIQNIIEEHSTGTTIKHASKAIEYLKMPISNINYNKDFDALYNNIINYKIKINELIKLKNKYLQKFFG